MLVGCSDNADEEVSTNNNDVENNLMTEFSEEDPTEAIQDDSDDASSEENKDVLSAYSNEQIEYARIWLQLGPNQELDALYVRLIPAGEPLHPEDETSVGYPEDVIQLSGTRLVDGSITYSGNGDGTINVYNVPLRWDGVYPAGEEFYQEMIDNTELVPVDTGDDEEVIALIKLLDI